MAGEQDPTKETRMLKERLNLGVPLQVGLSALACPAGAAVTAGHVKRRLALILASARFKASIYAWGGFLRFLN